MQTRPSVPELDKKIKTAIALIENGAVLVVNPAANADDAIHLGYSINKLQDVLMEILAEVKPEYYIGRRPPEKAYASQIQGSDLFIFRWSCKRFGCQLYLKFCIRGDIFYLVSLHENR